MVNQVSRFVKRGFTSVESPNERRKKFVVLIITVVLLVLVIFSYYYYPSCSNKTCFEDYLKVCKKAKFISGGNLVFEYKILGTHNTCDVSVLLLRGDLSNKESQKLVNKEMICSIPMDLVLAGNVNSPESDLSNCHGLLKEGLQDLIILKLHEQIVQNLGEINKEVYQNKTI